MVICVVFTQTQPVLSDSLFCSQRRERHILSPLLASLTNSAFRDPRSRRSLAPGTQARQNIRNAMRLPTVFCLADDSPFTTQFSLSPLESALPGNTPITPLESALTKSLDLKSFRIRTSKKRGGEGPLPSAHPDPNTSRGNWDQRTSLLNQRTSCRGAAPLRPKRPAASLISNPSLHRALDPDQFSQSPATRHHP